MTKLAPSVDVPSLIAPIRCPRSPRDGPPNSVRLHAATKLIDASTNSETNSLWRLKWDPPVPRVGGRGAVWMVRLRRGNEEVIVALGLTNERATRLAENIASLI